MSIEYQSVAVIDANADESIVWQVDVSADTQGSSRMCGAWVLAANEYAKPKLLTQARYLVATPAGDKALDRASAHDNRGVVDLAATVTVVELEITRLQIVFERAAATSKSSLVAPTWPPLPKAIDLGQPPVDVKAPQNVAVTLGIARWLEAVALVWESLERQRLIRKYMRDKDQTQRPFPLRLID